MRKSPNQQFRNAVIVVQKSALSHLDRRDKEMVYATMQVHRSLGEITGFNEPYASTCTHGARQLIEAWRRAYMSFIQMLYSGRRFDSDEAARLFFALREHVRLFGLQANRHVSQTLFLETILHNLEVCSDDCQPARHSELFTRTMLDIQIIIWRLFRCCGSDEFEAFERFDAWMGCFSGHLASKEPEITNGVHVSIPHLKRLCELAVFRFAVCKSFGLELPDCDEVNGEGLFASILTEVQAVSGIKLDVGPEVFRIPATLTLKARR